MCVAGFPGLIVKQWGEGISGWPYGPINSNVSLESLWLEEMAKTQATSTHVSIPVISELHSKN